MVEAARSGSEPRTVLQLASGWALMGDPQVLRGYTLLLPDPVVPSLNALAGTARARFLADMALLGDAVLAVTGALRVNYAMYGNLEPALHAHVIPRYVKERAPLATAHPWAYDWSAAPRFDPGRDSALMHAIRDELIRLGAGSVRNSLGQLC
jgi:diadenosine tetraphosphate (Ap4A) HIT family hydrolase